MSPRSDTIEPLNISLFAVAGAKVKGRFSCDLISSLLLGAGGQRRSPRIAFSCAASGCGDARPRARLHALVRPHVGPPGAPEWTDARARAQRLHCLPRDGGSNRGNNKNKKHCKHDSFSLINVSPGIALRRHWNLFLSNKISTI